MFTFTQEKIQNCVNLSFPKLSLKLLIEIKLFCCVNGQETLKITFKRVEARRDRTETRRSKTKRSETKRGAALSEPRRKEKIQKRNEADQQADWTTRDIPSQFEV